MLLVPVEGGEPREIVRVPDSNVVVPMAWTPNSHSVLFKKSFPSGENAMPVAAVCGWKRLRSRLVARSQKSTVPSCVPAAMLLLM